MMFLSRQSAYFCAAFLTAVAICTGQSYAGWQAPLSEQDTARLAAQTIALYQNDGRSSTATKTGIHLDVEVLMIELQEKKSRGPNEPRLAEVFIFDYSTNNASVQLFDADSYQLISTHPIDNIHLPLNERERALTHQILLTNERLLSELRSEYTTQFGKPLASLAQLDMKVSIWEPGISDTNTENCTRTRCALVSVFTHDHYNFSIEPVVDLQNAVVYLDLIQ